MLPKGIIHPDYFSLGSIFGVSGLPGHGGDAHFSYFCHVSQFMPDDFFITTTHTMTRPAFCLFKVILIAH